MDARILLACMPKSGSSFLHEALSILPGMTKAKLVPRYGRREQELCSDILAWHVSKGGGFVAQQHVRYSQFTQDCIAKYNLLPVVLVRNIFDVIPSLIDHHSKESTVYPFAYAPEEIVQWRFEEAARFVTMMVIPWYFNFYVSWLDCQEKLLVCYDDLIADPESIVDRIVAKTGAKLPAEEIRQAIVAAVGASPRKNAIVPGRGRAIPQECKDYIFEMAAFYKQVDFSPIGIKSVHDG